MTEQRWTPPPVPLCPATAEPHRWYAPVYQHRPTNPAEHYSYSVSVPVRSRDVRCWDCGEPAPTGTRKELG